MSNKENNLRIDYIEFPSTNLTADKQFYGAVFGWDFTDFGPDYASFDDGRLAGGLRKEATGGGAGTLVVIYAVDLEGVEANIKANGGAIVKETFPFPGGRRFHFTDPSSNELAVWSDK